MTFHSWLSEQTTRVDKVGMVAKLILTDNFTFDIKDNLASWQGYIARKPSQIDLSKIVQDAWLEYQH